MSKYQDPVEMLALEMRDRLAAATAQNEAMRQRAEAAEAVIASIPLAEIKYLVDHSKYGAVNRRCRDTVRAWLHLRA